MPRHTEPSANNALGGILQRMLPAYDVRSENTRQIVRQPNLRPDILIIPPGRSPVVVEAEFMPAYAAEDEARERLGLQVVRTGTRAIDAAIALRYPEDVADADDLHAAVRAASLSYAVHYNDGARFPQSGWLSGGVEELSDLIRLVSVPQGVVEKAADALERGIESAAEILEALGDFRPDAVTGIAALLGMSHATQTYRMASAIVANAMIFHERLASQLAIESLSTLCGENAPNPKADVLAAWDAILRVNYWTIFAFARDIIHRLPSYEAARLLRNLRATVEEVDAAGRRPGAKHHRAHLPAPHRRAQIPSDVLHDADVGLAPSAARRRAPKTRLGGRRRHIQTSRRRLRLRDRRAAVVRL